MSRLDYIIPGSINREEPTGTEPVTLAEAKAYLRIGFDEDDSLITDMIAEAREWAELQAGISIVQRNVSCTIHMGDTCRSLELPYGPVIGDPAAVKSDDDSIVLNSTNFTKGPFPRITGVEGAYDITYQAGYSIVPAGLKQVILAKLADLYENRGDSDAAVEYGKTVAARLKKFKRITWL